MSKNIEYLFTPKKSDLGDNFIVRRSLPRAEKRLVGPFIFWDHMGPVTLEGDRELKVRAHPHIGLSTITYLFSGSILHRDNLGNEQYIKPGEVNWMTAGKGIAHSERAKFERPTELEGIQLWVALPKEAEDNEPSFVHTKEDELPSVRSGAATLRLIAGEAFDKKSPLPVFSDLFYLAGNFEEDGEFTFELKPQQEAGFYAVDGDFDCEGSSLKRFDMAILKKGSKLIVKAKKGARFMLFGGEPFPEGRTIWWNLVSSDPAKIERAKADWREGRFDPVINETEFIPLPES